MMWRKFLMVGMVLALSMIFLTASSWATCEQQDLEGTWPVLVCGSVDCFGDHCLERCQLQVDANGLIQDTGAIMETGCGDWAITGGELTWSSGCMIRGYIETSNGTLNVSNGTIFEDKLVIGVSEE